MLKELILLALFTLFSCADRDIGFLVLELKAVANGGSGLFYGHLLAETVLVTSLFEHLVSLNLVYIDVG